MLRKGLRKDCRIVRFCCQRHKDKCLAPMDADERKRGPREPLDSDQILGLWNVLRASGAPWAAVMMLLQLQCGERGGCMVSARFGWLQNLNPDAADGPGISIPKVNGKTKPRWVPIIPEFAHLLHKWISGEPLEGGPCFGSTSYWPFAGQSMDPNAFMFPTCNVRGERLWTTHTTRHGYQKRLREAAEIIRLNRARRRQQGPNGHDCWDNYNLSKLGTHSLKRSSITMMKDVCKSTALVGSIAGTSPAICEKYYDYPSSLRQRDTLQKAFGCLYRRVRGKTRPEHVECEKEDGKFARFCTACGKVREDVNWEFCPWCSQKFYTGAFHRARE